MEGALFTQIKSIIELGSFAVLACMFIFGGIKVIKLLDKLVNNHAHTMQESLINMDKNLSVMSSEIKGLKDDLNVFTKTIEVFIRGKL